MFEGKKSLTHPPPPATAYFMFQTECEKQQFGNDMVTIFLYALINFRLTKENCTKYFKLAAFQKTWVLWLLYISSNSTNQNIPSIYIALPNLQSFFTYIISFELITALKRRQGKFYSNFMDEDT